MLVLMILGTMVVVIGVMENPALLSEDVGRYRAIGNIASPADVTFARVYDRLRCEELALCTTANQTAIGAKSVLDFAKLSSLDHPSLTRVRDFGVTDAGAFYSRELGFPSTLRDLSTARVDESWIFSCLVGATAGIAALHESGLVHGLVLPDHLQVSVVGQNFAGVRLSDAGLRRLLAPASLQARQRYDPPEVRAGAEITPAADVFQLGTTLFEALRHAGPSSAAKRPSRLAHVRWRGIDRNLVELLNGLVAPDPRKRYANGKDLRRAIESADWAMPDRSQEVKSLVTSQMVGREHELGRFAAMLEQPSTGQGHAIEFLGREGMGRTRILLECGRKAEAEGWAVVPVVPQGEPIAAILSAVRRVLDAKVSGRNRRGSTGELVASGDEVEGDGIQRLSRGAAEIYAAAERKQAKLLFLVDHADQLDSDMIMALRFLVTEAELRPVLVVSAGGKAVGLPGAERIELAPLGSRDLKRYLEPLLLSALNADEMFRAVERGAAGNPLWVQLLLASWLESGRLRLVQGRPFLDEHIASEAPQTIAETIFKIVASLSPEERELVEAMAVWGAPLPMHVAERVLSSRAEVPEALVVTTEDGYRFIGDTVGPAVLGLISPERKQHWNAAFLAVLAKSELSGSQHSALLLGAGRVAEAVRTLVEEAGKAQNRQAYAAAFRHLRDALDHYPSKAVAGLDRSRLALDAAKLATLVGQHHWAREVLATQVPVAGAEPALLFERAFLLAHVWRELRHAAEAAELYAEARALIGRHPSLRHHAVEVQLEEAANDAARGESERALPGVEGIVKSLEQEAPSHLLGLAVQRLATLHAHLGHSRRAAACELRCVRIARRLGDHQLVARASINLGHLYRLLGRPRRALVALDRARAELIHSPNDGLAASGLVNRAELLIGLGRTAEAEAALLRARALRERSGERGRLPTILIDLGFVCRHSGRLGQGAAYYREAIALAEEFELPIAQVAQSNLGELFLHLGEEEAAERHLRLSLADARPQHRGITLVNLGRLRREQGRYREALQFLAEAETLLRDSAPHYQPHVVLEASRVLLDAGDAEGASFRLLQVRDVVAKNLEQQAEYQLIEGLLAAARGKASRQTFDAALDGVRGSSDPTLRAETLIAVLERAMRLEELDESWLSAHLKALEAVAARTDARPVAIGARLVRGAFAERFPRRPAARDLAGDLQRKLERGESAVEAALGELMQQLPGAAGAAVFVVGVDVDGRPMVSPIPRASDVPQGTVRPYRVAVREFDRKLFREALAAAAGNVHEAARQLRLPTSTFRYRAIKLGLLKPAPRAR